MGINLDGASIRYASDANLSSIGDGELIEWDAGSNRFITSSPIASTNIYGSDGTITGNRTVQMDGGTPYSLTFLSGANIVMDIDGSTNKVGIGEATSTMKFNVKADSALSTAKILNVNSTVGSSMFTVYGDGTTYISGNIGVGVAPNSIIHAYFVHSKTYGIYVQGGNYAFTAASYSVNGFYSPNIYGNSPAYKCENPSGGSGGTKIAFSATDWGTNTGGRNESFSAVMLGAATTSVGFVANVTGATNNYAIEIVAGDIKTPSGVGITETLTFGGGTTGDVATLTVEKGVIIGRTLVP